MGEYRPPGDLGSSGFGNQVLGFIKSQPDDNEDPGFLFTNSSSSILQVGGKDPSPLDAPPSLALQELHD
eukprot:16221870-Heterocapsa_arctica.AAC.1